MGRAAQRRVLVGQDLGEDGPEAADLACIERFDIGQASDEFFEP